MALNERQLKFCEEFNKCGVAATAYKLAGYNVSSIYAASVNGCRLLKNANIKLELERLKAIPKEKQAISADYVIAKHIYFMDKADKKGDIPSATANLAYIGKTLALYTDNLNTADTSKQRALEQVEQEHAKRLANIMIKQSVA